jgi:gamma-glutamyltranspeptidase/glutathione hydrolase
MDLQEALDAPTVNSQHFPSSFYPREASPARMSAENRIPPDVIKALEKKGHKIEITEGWVKGKVMAIRYDKTRGIIFGAVSPKGKIGYAFGW